MEDLFINMGLSTLFTLLKNLKGSKNRAKYRAAILKLFKSIKMAYGDDPDFQ